MWLRAVFSAMYSSAAISRFDLPCATSRRTSTSRAVSPPDWDVRRDTRCPAAAKTASDGNRHRGVLRALPPVADARHREGRARGAPDAARAVGDRPPPRRADGPSRTTPCAASPRGKPDPSIRSSCLVATDTTDSKPPTRLSIRPVRYGYIRRRSDSAVLSGPFFSQMWLDTPNLPSPCTRPAR